MAAEGPEVSRAQEEAGERRRTVPEGPEDSGGDGVAGCSGAGAGRLEGQWDAGVPGCRRPGGQWGAGVLVPDGGLDAGGGVGAQEEAGASEDGAGGSGGHGRRRGCRGVGGGAHTEGLEDVESRRRRAGVGAQRPVRKEKPLAVNGRGLRKVYASSSSPRISSTTTLW